MNTPLLNGTVYECELDCWQVRWETDGKYRHWCSQSRAPRFNGKYIVVCLLNPGSLTGRSENLRSDTTLRILREVFDATEYGCLVVNLFDRATTKPAELFSVSTESDKVGADLVYTHISDAIAGNILGYGDYEHHEDASIARQIKARIELLGSWAANFPPVANPINRNGTPKHVMRWQIEGLKCLSE